METRYTEDNLKEKSTLIAKCQGCGADLVWSPIRRCLICEHCGTLKSVDISNLSEELDYVFMLNTNTDWSKETRLYRCNNCGAKEILSNAEISTQCSFCGATNVVESDEIVGLKPNAIIPFFTTKEEASENALKWMKKKIFAPRKFKKSASPEEIKGCFTPAFTFDADTNTTYSGRLGKNYFVKIRVNGKEITEVRTKYFNISGEFKKSFDDVTIQASTAIDTHLMRKIQPYDTFHSNAYSEEFLHGYTATQYTKDGETCWQEAKDIMYVKVSKAILAEYDYDVIEDLKYDVSYNNIKFKYVLLPVYIGHYNWKAKLYNFIVNGRNGKVAGKVPISPLKVGIATAIGLIIVAGIVALYYLINEGII